MIKITLETNGKDVLDSLEFADPTLEEYSVINFRLDQIKQILIEKDFESKFEVREGDFAEDGED